MNIKGILRSTVVKLIAFAGIVGCFAGALFLVENTITDFAANGWTKWSIALRAILPTRPICISSSA